TVDAKSGKSPPYFFRPEQDGTTRIAKDLKKAREDGGEPTSVIIALGTNFKEDMAENGAAYARSNMEPMVNELRKQGYKGEIIWIGRPTNPDDMTDGGEKIRRFDR